ncbi:MAG: hypothetical protein JW984_01340 [Deltaproteobacteria bacterium]|uniref:Uncharacterized protein n=1 Tax=Candidatus Zymogenus saltonus TaxID=2844893 RepID=A0A9D8PM79_9DELT|nr:hypothetical protein [Candidatus Zymogenus saltonus]
MVTRRDKGAKVKKKSIGTTPGRIVRIVSLVAGFVLLGTIFLMIVIPRERGTVAPPAGDFSAKDGAAEKIKENETKEAPETDDDNTVIEDSEEPAELGEEEVDADKDVVGEEKGIPDFSGVYTGTGESETADSKTVWEVSMELSGDSYVYIEGKVNHVEDTVKGTGSGMEFTISENSVELKISATDKDDILISSRFDKNTVNIFSLNEQRQFFLYVTPKKVNINTVLLREKLPSVKEHTPLIDMSGFMKEDGDVVGMLRSPFVPMVEYSLELVGD